MNINSRTRRIVLTLFIAIVAIGGSLLLMGQLATTQPAISQPPPPPTASPTGELPPANRDDIVATINEEIITNPEWQQAVQLDAVMSRLANQPLPTNEETLDRLINEIIVLSARPDVEPPDSQAIEARITALEDSWDVTDQAVVTALEEVGLSRADWVERVGRLMQVETALSQLMADHENLNDWLAEARTSAEIGLYRTLANRAVPTPAATTVQMLEPPTFSPPPGMAVAPYPQQAAPEFTLNQLDGQPMTLSDLRGQPTLINFWAGWCPPCRREIPALQAAYATYADQVGFMAINVKESPAAVADRVEEMGLDFPVLLDPEGQVSSGLYEVRGLPTTIFVDARGVVAARHVGPLDEATIDSYLSPLLAAQQSRTGAPQESGEAEEPGQPTSSPAQPAPDSNTSSALPQAPGFSLAASGGETISLQDYQGQHQVVLVFYRGFT